MPRSRLHQKVGIDIGHDPQVEGLLDLQIFVAAALGALVLLGLPTVPVCFRWLLHLLAVDKLNPTVGAKFNHLGARTIVVGWITIAFGWLVQGMSLWAVLRAMGAATDGPFNELSLHTTAVALGVVAGFISQIPGGLVVREWVSGELLQAHYGQSVALVSAILLRMVWLVSELVVSIILYVAGLRRTRAMTTVDDHRVSSSSSHDAAA